MLTCLVAAALGFFEDSAAGERRRARLRQIAGWGILGALAVLGELALFSLLYRGMGLAQSLAYPLASESMILVRFLLTDRVVFGHAAPTWGRTLRYHGACAGAFAITWLVIAVAERFALAEGEVAWAVGTAVSLVWSLLASFLWVWRLKAAV